MRITIYLTRNTTKVKCYLRPRLVRKQIKRTTQTIFSKKLMAKRKAGVAIFVKRFSKDNGYSNLVSHLSKQHPDYIKIYDVQAGKAKSATTLDKMWLVTENAKKIHFWMRKVVFLPAPFSYVENPIAREVTSYISFNYWVKHIELSQFYTM